MTADGCRQDMRVAKTTGMRGNGGVYGGEKAHVGYEVYKGQEGYIGEVGGVMSVMTVVTHAGHIKGLSGGTWRGV